MRRERHFHNGLPRNWKTAAMAIVFVSGSLAWAAVTFDGTFDFSPGGEWGGPKETRLQDNYTGFGDQILSGWSGSELDELYMRTDGEYLYIAVTGNLEFNGNAQVILLDVRSGGLGPELRTEITPPLNAGGTVEPCQGVGPPWTVPNLGQALILSDSGTPGNPDDDLTIRDPASTPLKLDAGFQPDYAISYDTFGGVLYVSQYNLSATALGQWDDPNTNNGNIACANRVETLDYYATRVYRGSNLVGNTLGTVDGGINPNGSLFAYDNGNFQGVTATAVAAPGSSLPGDPRTATRGFESKISLLDLGFTPAQLPLTGSLNVKVQVILASAGGYVSNQSLPGIGGGLSQANLAFRPDYGTILNNQYASVTLNVAPFAPAPVIDGQNILSEWGASSIVASQDTVTGFGDRPQNPNLSSPGSEICRLVVQDGPTGILHLGLTGNLEANGNNVVIFFDTRPGGEDLLAGNVGRIAGNNGDRLPMQADYAILANIFAGNLYLDWFDLTANTQQYIGMNGINNGIGDLTNGSSPVPDWKMSLNNTNVVGVSANPADDPVVQTTKAASATTGFEFAIPLAQIGDPPPGTTICIFAMITGNGGDRWLSNQLLPAGIGGGKPNWGDGGGSRTNLAAQGYTCLPVVAGTAPVSCNNPRFDADGDGDVDQVDFGIVQACFTGSGGTPQDPLYPSECACYDWNTVASDGDIDQEDMGIFQICARGSIALGIPPSGPTIPASPNCDDPAP